MIRKIVLSLLFTVFFQGVLHSEELHLIIFADIVDSKIGTACYTDVDKMIQLSHQISKQTGLKLKKRVVAGRELTAESFQEAINIDVGSEDVVIFYWSGHGFRTSSKDGKSDLPYMYIPGDNIGVDHCEVTEALEEKGPRLLFSMSDACNNYLPEDAIQVVPLAAGMIWNRLDSNEKENYKQLFLKSRGKIVATGSQPGGYATCHKNYGGFLTFVVINELKSSTLQDKKSSWYQIFSRATKTLESLDDEQVPLISIELEE